VFKVSRRNRASEGIISVWSHEKWLDRTYCAAVAGIAVRSAHDPSIAIAHRVIVAADAAEFSGICWWSDRDRRNVLLIIFDRRLVQHSFV